MSNDDQPAAAAESDLRAYGLAMRRGLDVRAASIEDKWGLYGYPPEIVSTVLSLCCNRPSARCRNR